jgi:hypothetical protein
MRILVTSASGANGSGYGAILGFDPEGEFTGPFSSDPRIAVSAPRFGKTSRSRIRLAGWVGLGDPALRASLLSGR